MSYPIHWKSNSILMTNQHTKVYCMPLNNYSCFTASRSILYSPTKRLKACLESHGMVSQSQIQYVLSVPTFTKQGNLERLKSNLSYFSAKTVWIVQILNQTFDCLEVFTCTCIALSHSLSQLVWTYAWPAHVKLMWLQTLPHLIFTIWQKLEENQIFVHPDLSLNAFWWDQRMNVGTECSQNRWRK